MMPTTHPGDWLWIIADGRMVAMTHDAYDAARRIVELQRPDVYDQLRAHQRGTGELYKLALGILERDGELRVELHGIPQRDDIRVQVYTVATAQPPDAEAPAPQRSRRPKQRYRHKRAPAAPPALAVVGGTAAE